MTSHDPKSQTRDPNMLRVNVSKQPEMLFSNNR